MKRIAIGLAATLALAACGGGGTASQATATPTAARTTAAPTPTPTPQTTFVFTAALKSTEENPPIAGAEAPCNGTFEATFNRTDRTARFEFEIKGCPDSAAINIAHIHEGAKGVNGPVRVNSGLVAGEVKLTGGGAKVSKNIPAIDAAVFDQILANPGAFYFNVHSTANPVGVIRGPLEKKS